MKATYNGITMEGSPKEIAELKRLLDEQYKITYTQPYTPFVPWKPSTNWTTGVTPYTYYGQTNAGVTWTTYNANNTGDDIRIKTINAV